MDDRQHEPARVLYFVAPFAGGWRVSTIGDTWDFPTQGQARVRALVYAKQIAERGVPSGMRLHLGDGDLVESVDFGGQQLIAG